MAISSVHAVVERGKKYQSPDGESLRDEAAMDARSGLETPVPEYPTFPRPGDTQESRAYTQCGCD